MHISVLDTIIYSIYVLYHLVEECLKQMRENITPYCTVIINCLVKNANFAIQLEDFVYRVFIKTTVKSVEYFKLSKARMSNRFAVNGMISMYIFLCDKNRDESMIPISLKLFIHTYAVKL